MQTSYTPLEGKNLTSLGVPAPTFGGVSTSFYATSTFIYTLFFVAIVGAAFFQYVLAGIYRMEASTDTIRKSNDTIKRVTLGLLGVFSLFLILFTVNKGMLRGDIGFDGMRVSGNTSNNQVVRGTTVPTTNARNTPFIPANNDDPTGWNAIKNDPDIRAQLRNLPNGGISVNKSVCVTPAQTSCTTVGGLPQATLSMLSNLRGACTGTITVTGGSEAGHQSHGPGKSPADLSMNSPGGLNSCIQSFPTGPAYSFCKKTYEKFGYIFCDEWGLAHWHVFQK